MGDFQALVAFLLLDKSCLVGLLELVDVCGDGLHFFLQFVLDSLKELGIECQGLLCDS